MIDDKIMKEQIAQNLESAVSELVDASKNTETGTDMSAELQRPKNTAHGDWTSNVAFVLARSLRKSPQVIAGELVSKLRKLCDDDLVVVSVAGGYVNFTLTPKSHQQVLERILRSGTDFARNELQQANFAQKSGRGKRVLLEYVSANPTGPLHLGNARGGPIGDTLASVLELAGFEVAREYYVNDFGNQVTVLGHSVIGNDKAQYSGGYIEDLRKRLISDVDDVSNVGSASDIDEIQNAQKAGRQASQIIIDEIIRPALASAQIEFDGFFSEKSLHDSGAIDEVLRKLKDLGVTYEQDGAVFFASTKIVGIDDDKDRVLVTADGRKTYFCADIAYHLNKLSRADWLVNVWGSDHGGTVARLQGALSALGQVDKLDIVLTQFVRVMEDGVEVKMSKRRGTYIALSDLIEEVGADVTRFLFLMQTANTHVVFDLNAAREKSDKNPVYYVQYAHARMASILRKADEQVIDLDFAQNDLSLLVHAKEINLIRALAEFSEIVLRTAGDYGVHRLPHYAIKLADNLHSFYGACKVIDADNVELSKARIALIQATKTQLAEVLRIVGVSAPEKM